MGDLKAKIKARDNEVSETKNNVVKSIAKSKSSNGEKDKMISVKVNSSTYELFTKINKALGMSNNSCINQLISKYVLDNKNVIE